MQRTRLFEVFNGHPPVNNLGGGGVPGLEEVWDRILSSGRLLYGIAVDDAHTFKRPEDKTVRPAGHGLGLRAGGAARAARDRGSARARRFLFVYRRRVAVGHVSPSSALTIAVKSRERKQVPHPIHRPAGRDAERSDHQPGDIHVQGR